MEEKSGMDTFPYLRGEVVTLGQHFLPTIKAQDEILTLGRDDAVLHKELRHGCQVISRHCCKVSLLAPEAHKLVQTSVQEHHIAPAKPA